MRMRDRVSCSALFWLVVTACGGAQAPDAEAVEVGVGAGGLQLPAEAYLPGDTFGVVELQLGAVRSSPYYEPMRALLASASERGGADGLSEVLPELLQRLDGVTIAFGALDGNPAELTGVILRGSFTVEEATRWMSRLDQGGDEPAESLVIAGRPALAKREGLLVQIDATTWILGPRAHLARRVEAPSMPAALSDPAYLDAASRSSIGAPALRLTALAVPPMQDVVASEWGLDPAQAAHLRAIGATVGVSDGIDAEAHVLTSDASLAAAIVQRVTMQRDALSSQPPVRMLGLGNILDSARLDQAGTDASLRIQVPDGTVRMVLGMLQGFLQMGGAE